MAFSLEFQKFSSVTRPIFFTVGQNNFGNEIPFTFYIQYKKQKSNCIPENIKTFFNNYCAKIRFCIPPLNTSQPALPYYVGRNFNINMDSIEKKAKYLRQKFDMLSVSF